MHGVFPVALIFHLKQAKTNGKPAKRKSIAEQNEEEGTTKPQKGIKRACTVEETAKVKSKLARLKRKKILKQKRNPKRA